MIKKLTFTAIVSGRDSIHFIYANSGVITKENMTTLDVAKARIVPEKRFYARVKIEAVPVDDEDDEDL